jgi:serine protease SohB
MRMPLPFLSRPPRVAVVRLSGAIGGAARLGAGLSDEATAPVLERAFTRGRPAAVALLINSPGGSAVQSSLIAARIRALAERHRLPVHAFVEDVAASGGYWLALAADDIWADASSVVGSIGVISSSFGFAALLERQGIERRVHTAGRSKSLADPFLPENPQDVARLRAILEPIHANFIAEVRARRGARLSEDPALFEGEVWVGREAVAKGLADGIAHAEPKLREIYGAKVRLVPHGQRRSFLRRMGVGAAGAELASELAALVEARALWSRYGV